MTLRPLSSGAWDGRVVFLTRPASFKVLSATDDLKRLIDEHCPGLPANLAVSNLAWLIASTEDILFEFQGDEGTPLLNLQEFWQAYKAAKKPSQQIALAVEWYMSATNDVIATWMEAVENATVTVRRPEQLPASALNEDEKVEAAQPDSPLVELEPSL